MNLVGKCLHVILHCQILLELFDVIDILALRREYADRDRDLCCIGGVEHGGVHFCGDAEGGSRRGQ